jgi:hypothetical protein
VEIDEKSADAIFENALSDASHLYEQYLLLSKVTDVASVLNTPLEETRTWGAPLTVIVQR